MPTRRPKIFPSLRVSHRKRTHRAAGEAPGTVVVEPDAEVPTIRAIGFSTVNVAERELEIGEVRAFADEWPVVWLDVVGIGDADAITAIGELFDLHPLALEDVAHPHERAKVEVYEHYLFIVARMAHHRELGGGRHDQEELHDPGVDIYVEQFSLFVGDGWVITFQEHEGDSLEPVRDRIRHGRGRIRHRKADYLAYAFLDALTDAYFPILDEFAEVLERLEDRVIAGDDDNLIEILHDTKRALVPIRRAVFPLRDVVKFLEIDSGDTISDETRIYLRDVDDHLAIILDQLDSLRDLSSSLMDVHYNVLSHRMNEVMKVLTVMSTIFIPLSFIVGLYGMNFNTEYPLNMPELHWRYGYMFVWAVMLSMVGGMIVFFRKKRWF